MAIRTVTIEIRIKTPDGKRPYVSPVWVKKGTLKAGWARVGNKPEHHPEGVYVLRYGSKREFVGRATDRVMARRMAIEKALEDAANAPAQALVVPITRSGLTILDAMETYLAKKAITDHSTGKEALAPKTISELRGVIEAFQRTCKKEYMREVTGEDFVGYFTMLRVQANLDPKAPDYSERLRKRNVTVKGHYDRLRAFFKKFKVNIADMLEDEQIPRCKGRVPDAYTEAEIKKMWAVCKPEEKIRLQVFCATGFRKREVAYLTWDDVDLKTGILRVTPKMGWRPKNRTSREVRLPDYLVTALSERRKKYPNDTLVFPSKRGLPARSNQLLYMLKSVAERAGIKGRVDLHKFRSTYASFLNRSGKATLEEISGRLGHADIATTRIYLARMNQNTDRAREQSNEALAAFA